MKTRFITFVILMVTACSPRFIPAFDSAQIPSSTLPRPTGQELATPDRMITNIPARVSQTQVTTPITGEVPAELLYSILQDLAERTGTASEQISVIQAEEIVWNDGSLGCPQPGMFYTQALVNGYWVILEIDGKRFDYRGSDTDYFFLCENGIPPISHPSTPSS